MCADKAYLWGLEDSRYGCGIFSQLSRHVGFLGPNKGIKILQNNAVETENMANKSDMWHKHSLIGQNLFRELSFICNSLPEPSLTESFPSFSDKAFLHWFLLCCIPFPKLLSEYDPPLCYLHWFYQGQDEVFKLLKHGWEWFINTLFL